MTTPSAISRAALALGAVAREMNMSDGVVVVELDDEETHTLFADGTEYALSVRARDESSVPRYRAVWLRRHSASRHSPEEVEDITLLETTSIVEALVAVAEHHARNEAWNVVRAALDPEQPR